MAELGLDSRLEKEIIFFFTTSRPALGRTQPPMQWIPGVVSPSTYFYKPSSLYGIQYSSLRKEKILSRVWVTKEGVEIGNWIYWILTGRNYK
jgi:hypothetical protein